MLGPEMLTAVAPVRLVPVMVTATLVPCVPEVGLIEVTVGKAGGGARAPVPDSTAPTSEPGLASALGLPKKSVAGRVIGG